MIDASIQQWNKLRADAIAVIDADGQHSWGALAAMAERFAGVLRRHKLAGRCVALLPQRGASIALLAACTALRLDVLLVSALYGEAQARAQLERFAAGGLLTVQGDQLVLLTTVGTAGQLAATPGGDTQVVLLTSGSTGQPKYVCHTWESLLVGAKRRDEFTGTRWLTGYPIALFAGLQVLAQCLLNGGTLVFPPDFSAAAALAALSEHAVAFLCCTPTYLRQLLLAAPAHAWSGMQLQHVTLGGEIVDQHLLDRVAGLMPGVRVTQVYASTEIGAIISVRDGQAGFDAALLDGTQLKVIDGELFARRSARAMRGYLERPTTGDEWIATGDLVEVAHGRVWFRGRTNDVINVGGTKVSPVAVEEVIRPVSGVVDVRVVGHRSSIIGQLIKAIVWIAPDADQAAVRSAIQHRCAEQLPEPMRPRLFEFADQLDLAPSQKFVRRHSQ